MMKRWWDGVIKKTFGGFWLTVYVAISIPTDICVIVYVSNTSETTLLDACRVHRIRFDSQSCLYKPALLLKAHACCRFTMYPSSSTKPRRRPHLPSSSSPQHNPITPSSSRSQLHPSSRDHSSVRQEITDEQRHEIKEAFELFDTDKDGYIDYHELKVIPVKVLIEPRRWQCVP